MQMSAPRRSFSTANIVLRGHTLPFRHPSHRANTVDRSLGFRHKARMLVIENLSVRVAGRLLLDEATVRIPAGSRTGLVGRNGTGKTTLFNVITGDLGAESGELRVRATGEGRASAAGSAVRTREPARSRAEGRPRASRAAGRGRARDRSAPDRRYPDPAGRYRRPFGAVARGRDPVGPGLSGAGSGARGVGIFRRLADAGGAGGGPVRAARSAAARRTDQLSRPRRHARGWKTTCPAIRIP